MSRSAFDSASGPYRAEASVSARKTALRRGEYPIAVYGLGKIGLPVAVAIAELAGNVTGVDVDPDVVTTINAGTAPFEHEPDLPQLLASAVTDDRLTATTDVAAAAAGSNVHIVVVPVGLDDDGGADLRAVEEVAATIGAELAPGDLVVIESTVPPGTAVDVVKPILTERSGLAPDAFGLAVAPERTSSGRALEDVRGTHPRVIGGVDAESTDAARAVYEELVDNTVIGVDATTAELVKLFEGVYRDVNIALANELAKAWDGMDVDVREAIATANTQPYCDIHDPGAGVGGHCIPWYPYFLMEATDRPMPLTETARRVNDGMPTYLAHRTLSLLEDDDIAHSEATVAILGLAYRPDIPETAASPTYPLVDRLETAGGNVIVVDPIVDDPDDSVSMWPLEDLPDADPDAVVLVTGHERFGELPEDLLAKTVVVDGRDALETDATREYVVGRDR